MRLRAHVYELQTLRKEVKQLWTALPVSQRLQMPLNLSPIILGKQRPYFPMSHSVILDIERTVEPYDLGHEESLLECLSEVARIVAHAAYLHEAEWEEVVEAADDETLEMVDLVAIVNSVQAAVYSQHHLPYFHTLFFLLRKRTLLQIAQT